MMIYEEALNIVTGALAPQRLNPLQIGVFQRSWHEQSYTKIARKLNHSYSYIKDVGAELWQLLSQALGMKIRKHNLRNALAQYIQNSCRTNLSALSQHKRLDWGEAPNTCQFSGRAAQLATLKQWVIQEHCRLVTIAGMVGIGKTMLVTKFAQQLADTELFEVVVWRSLRQAPPFNNFLTELLNAIAPGQSPGLQPDAMMRLLLEQLRYHRYLLILDGVEAVLQGSELVGTYRPGYEDYEWLFQQLGEGQHQSTILLTSRELPPEIATLSAPRAAVRLLQLEPLSIEAGEQILAAKGLFPVERAQVQQLFDRYQGNPQMLAIAATLIKESFNSNIILFLAQKTLLFKDIGQLLAQQLNRLSEIEWQVMFCITIHHQPITLVQLEANLLPSISQAQLQNALVSLNRRSLIEIIEPTSANPSTLMYTLQPLIAEAIKEKLSENSCG
ncbi:NACHT domain-containing protein [Aliterella atlantica]|uniref:NACHT domain-containing protein n=1 Tax=Aliterella atlantica TaxID=1827278 RepID=UPI0009E4EF5D|nr:NACHT domain-containing protein [Aliterella atlantica]